MSATFDDVGLERLLPMMKRPRRFDVRQADQAAPQAVRHLYALVNTSGHPGQIPPPPATPELPALTAGLQSATAAAAAAAAGPEPRHQPGGWRARDDLSGNAPPPPPPPPPRATGAALEAEVEAKASELLKLLRSILFNQVRSSEVIAPTSCGDCAPQFTPHGRHECPVVPQVMDELIRAHALQAVVFCNDPTIAPALADHLAALGVPTVHVSARLPQATRLAAITALRTLGARVAVTSDVLARGVDLEYVNLVVNFDLPRDGATYAHRLGRAGRFGAAAVAVTLITGPRELGTLRGWAATCGCGALSPLPPAFPCEPSPLSAPERSSMSTFLVCHCHGHRTAHQRTQVAMHTSIVYHSPCAQASCTILHAHKHRVPFSMLTSIVYHSPCSQASCTILHAHKHRVPFSMLPHACQVPHSNAAIRQRYLQRSGQGRMLTDGTVPAGS